MLLRVLDMYALMETLVPVVLRCVGPEATTRACMYIVCACVRGGDVLVATLAAIL